VFLFAARLDCSFAPGQFSASVVGGKKKLRRMGATKDPGRTYARVTAKKLMSVLDAEFCAGDALQ
jgi:hypothetical protein